jgi:hypothetical protein
MSFLPQAWTPKSILLLREYNFDKFISDLIAGVTVGHVATTALKRAEAIREEQLMQAALSNSAVEMKH